MIAVVQELSDLHGEAPAAADVARHFSLEEAETRGLLDILVGEGSLLRIGERYAIPQDSWVPVAFAESELQKRAAVASKEPRSRESTTHPAPTQPTPLEIDASHAQMDSEGARIEPEPATAREATVERSAKSVIFGDILRRMPQKSEESSGNGEKQAPGWQVRVIRVVIGFAGIAAAIVSAYLVILRLESFIPPALAILLGSVLVAFATIAFETIIVFLQRRRRAFAVLFSAVWLLIWSFTLVACLSGFWNFYANIQTQAQASTATSDAARQRLELIRQSELDLRGEIAQKTKEIADLESIVSGLSSVEMRESKAEIYNESSSRLLSREAQLSRLQDQLEAYRTQEAAVIGQAPEAGSEIKRQDFYAWLGATIHVSPDSIELVTALMPAALIDIISSTGIALALFL
jgi:hypothetical protein